MPDDRSRRTAPSRLLELSRGYRASRTFLTAVELDVFARMGEDRLPASRIAKRIGGDPAATEILLDGLVGLGLLDRTSEGYRNVDALAVLWHPDTGEARRGFGHAAKLWSAWSRLTEVVRRGRPPGTNRGTDECGWASNIGQFSSLQTEAIADALDWSRVGRLIDIGGGTGVHSIGLARRHPGLQAVVFDASDAALGIASEAIAHWKLGDRVTVRRGDLLRDDFGSGFDAALVSMVTCLLGEDDVRLLLARIAAALSSGGLVVIHDFMLEDSGSGSAGAALFGVHLLLTSPRGRCHRRADVERWVSSGGFERIRTRPVGEMRMVVAAREAGKVAVS